VVVTQANTNTISVGDHIVAVFIDCDDGLGYVIDGTVDMTIIAVEGDIITDVFLLGMDILMTDIVVTGGAGAVTADGDFMLTLDSMDFPILRVSMAGDELQLGGDGEIITLTDFDHAFQVDTGVFPEALVANVLGRLDSLLLAGSVDYETPVAIAAVGDDDPHVGEILVTGADDSSVRIVIIDDTHVQLEIDENGDGTVDTFVDTTWAELNGHEPPTPPPPPPGTSLIDAETAPILAREVYNAVSGFGYLTIFPGLQFLPVAPLEQLNVMGISSDFGPVMIECDVSGTVTVSGHKALATSFSAGDKLDVIYDLCARPGEKLDGSMEFSIGSFSQMPDSAYVVSGTVAQSGLLRVIGGSCFSGTGTIETNFDYQFLSTGSIHATSSGTNFDVWAGGRSQQLTGASVGYEITSGEPFTLLMRESSGVMTSEDAGGSYSYQSLSPDQFYADEDAATGPFSGELMVTASDGSSMRMVALGELDVRLDLDFDGDAVIDDSILTTYATLAYDDWICP
jgi:hypothetical protein